MLHEAGYTAEQVDWLVPHQANKRIIDATAKHLGLPEEKIILTVQEHANTSAASIPLALDAGIKDGRIRRGQHLMMEGSVLRLAYKPTRHAFQAASNHSDSGSLKSVCVAAKRGGSGRIAR